MVGERADHQSKGRRKQHHECWHLPEQCHGDPELGDDERQERIPGDHVQVVDERRQGESWDEPPGGGCCMQPHGVPPVHQDADRIMSWASLVGFLLYCPAARPLQRDTRQGRHYFSTASQLHTCLTTA
jgi:hypothetical protein